MNRSDVTPEMLAAAYREGASIASLAAQTGLAASTVRSRLTNAGVELRGRGRPSGSLSARSGAGSLVTPEAVAAAYAEVKSITELSRRFRVSPPTIRARLRDAGVMAPPRRAKHAFANPGAGRPRGSWTARSGATGDVVTVEYVMELSKSGLSQRAIAAALGVSPTVVRTRLAAGKAQAHR